MSLVDLGKRLLESARKGDTDEVRMLMTNGAPFTTDWLGISPLHYAAMHGHVSTAEVLLRAGISRDARTKVDRTPLHVAAQNGHSELVELLLKNGADIDAKDMLKMTPLHWAVERAHMPVILTLIKQGADVTCENKFDMTPLDIAFTNSRGDIISCLQTSQVESVLPKGQETDDHFNIHVEPSEVASATVTITSEPDDSNTDTTKPSTVPTTSSSESGDQSSTSVLATLAALAEATAPLATAPATGTSAAEALNWLETHGITMMSSGDEPAVVTAIEDGQAITLTEAGKLALKFVKQQNSSTSDGGEAAELAAGDQKVITIVADESSGTVVTMEDEENDNEQSSATDVDGEPQPASKKMKLETDAATEEGDAISRWLTGKQSFENLDQDQLRRQLEQVQKQAEEYKQQLKQKEEEAEGYKKQLKVINTTKQ